MSENELLDIDSKKIKNLTFEEVKDVCDAKISYSFRYFSTFDEVAISKFLLILERRYSANVRTIGIYSNNSTFMLQINPYWLACIDKDNVRFYLAVEAVRLALQHPTSRKQYPDALNQICSSLITNDDLFSMLGNKKNIDIKDFISYKRTDDWKNLILKNQPKFVEKDDFYLEAIFFAMKSNLENTNQVCEKKWGQSESKEQENKDGEEKCPVCGQKMKDHKGQNGEKQQNPNGQPQPGKGDQEGDDGEDSNQQGKGGSGGQSQDQSESDSGNGKGGSGGNSPSGEKGNDKGQGNGNGEGEGDDGEGNGNSICPNCGQPTDGEGNAPGGQGNQQGDYKKYENEKEATDQYNNPFENDNSKGWNDSEINRNRVEQEVRRMADSTKQWGSIAGNLRDKILLENMPKVDYRRILRTFAQNIQVNMYETTRMKRNRRYGFRVPGYKRLYKSSVLFAIDSSGSMGEGQIEMCLEILKGCMKGCQLDYCFWDCSASIPVEVDFKQKKLKEFDVSGGGGTDPSCIWRMLEEQHKHYDGYVVLSDMYFAKQDEGPKKSVWISVTEDEAPTSFGIKMFYKDLVKSEMDARKNR